MAADLMIRYAHVGDLGKTVVQLIRGPTPSRNIAQFGKNILYNPLKLSGRHRGNMEDTFLDGIFLGMRLRSDEILVGTTTGVIKTRTQRRRVEEEQWDNDIARSIKGEPRQLVPGVNSDHVPAAISDRAGVTLEEDQADTRLEQQDEGIDPQEAREVSMPPDRLVTQVRSDTLKRVRHERFGQETRSNTWMSRMCQDWQSTPSQSLGHMQGRDGRRTGEL